MRGVNRAAARHERLRGLLESLNRPFSRDNLTHAHQEIAPRSDFPNFNDPDKLGDGAAMVERLGNLIGIFQNPPSTSRGTAPSTTTSWAMRTNT